MRILVWIEPVIFNNLLSWLSSLDEKHALHVTQIVISVDEKPRMFYVPQLDIRRNI
ncbi:type II secretion system protein GspM [Escherichia albertii]|uniref:type II secretion system protein GspM n=1 Tax=Escherichia albertii TaxID=208962 RepID=UPI003F7324EB